MSVHQLKDGRWFCTYRVNGIQKREYFGRGKSAEQNARDRDLELHPNRTPEPPGVRLVDAVNTYLQAKSGMSAASTLEDQYYKFSGTILPRLNPNLICTSLNFGRLDDYVRTRRNDGVKDVTIHTEITALQSVLNWAADPERGNLIPHNPVARYPKPKRDDSKQPPPSPKEIDLLLQNSSPHLIRAICISYYTGLRPGAVELLALTWDNVDMINHNIHIVSAKKGGLVERYVPIAQDFLPILEQWKADDKENGLIISWNGKPIKSIKTSWKAAKRRAGITRKMRPYDLRHAFATATLSRGSDLKAVSKILGHSRPDTTVRVYQHVEPENMVTAVENLPVINIGKHPPCLPQGRRKNKKKSRG